MGCGRKDDQHKEKTASVKWSCDQRHSRCCRGYMRLPANCFQEPLVRSSLPEEDRPPIRGYSS